MFNKNKKRKGLFITEIIMSLTVLGMLIIVLVISLHSLAKFNLYQLVRMQCTAAAQAQLDSIAATGQPVSGEEFKRLWPKLDVSIEQSQGEGQWSGLRLITVKTKGMSYNVPVKVSLSKYISSLVTRDPGLEGSSDLPPFGSEPQGRRQDQTHDFEQEK